MDYKNLSKILRDILKTRNITYKDIASKLDMSESGVKKMLTARDISYNKLHAILYLLNLRIEDVTPLAPKTYKKLSEEQEKFLLKNNKHFNFFIQLHHHKMKLDSLKKSNSKLSKEKISLFISDLEKVKMIQVIDGQIHSLLEEGFQTSKDFNERHQTNYEAVLKKLREMDPGQWKPWMFEGLGTFSLSHNSALELRNQIHSLFKEFSGRSEREKKTYEAKDLINTGTLIINIPMKIQDAFPIL